MKNPKSILVIIITFLFLNGLAQYGPGRIMVKRKSDIKITAGNIGNLLNVNRVNIVYDYSNMSVGDFSREEDYLDKKAAEYEKKEVGKGEKFKQNWVAARAKRYEPKFETLFNEIGSDFGISGTNYSTDNDITLKVTTIFTEPGFNAGVTMMPAYISIECSFIDKNNVELLHYSITNAQGMKAMGVDFEASMRIEESYAKGAKMLMKDIKKKLKKIKK